MGIPPGRPIISDCDSYNIAKFTEFYLNSLSRHNGYIKDVYDFIDKIRNIQVPINTFLLTTDITSLNTDTELGLRAVAEMFCVYPNVNCPDQALHHLLCLGLTRNDFLFNGRLLLFGKHWPSLMRITTWPLRRPQFSSNVHRCTQMYTHLDKIFGLESHSLESFIQFPRNFKFTP